MKLETSYIDEMTIEQFAEAHGLTMQVLERRVPQGAPHRYYAHFKDADIKEGGCLVGTFGNGPSPAAAIDDYAREIALKRLVINACDEKNRLELEVPRLNVNGVIIP